MSLTTLPPELLQMILNLLTPMHTEQRTDSTGPILPILVMEHPYTTLNSLGRTCRSLHFKIKPRLFSQYIRRPNGDDVGLIYFVRALLAVPGLGNVVRCLQIDDTGCISSPFAPKLQEPRKWEPRGMFNEAREFWEEGREMVPGCQRWVDETGWGKRFAGCKRGWGSFASLEEEDWMGGALMNEREWEGLERKVYGVCASRTFQVGRGQDRELSAVEMGRQIARTEKGMLYTFSTDPRKGTKSVETEEQAKDAEKGNVTARFGLERRKRPVVDEYIRIHGVDDNEYFEGWRYDEAPPPLSRHTPPMLARRWIRALRRGSRDAWSALLLVLATGTHKLMAMESNWFARPNPYNGYDMLEPERVRKTEERYREEDEEWEALGGYTWVGRVMWACAADQAYYRELFVIHQEQAEYRTEHPPSGKRQRAMSCMSYPHLLGASPWHSGRKDIRILPNIHEVILGSSSSLTAHPNLSLNTLLHFLQPPFITHAIFYGLSDATFGIHERKPPGIVQAKLGLKAVILQNCNASADCLGFLASLCPDLVSFAHRGVLRELFRTSILPKLDPEQLVGYLGDYCSELKALDLDAGNEYEQHALDWRFVSLRVRDFRVLGKLESLVCRVEHLIWKVEDEDSEQSSGVQSYASSIDASESEELEDGAGGEDGVAFTVGSGGGSSSASTESEYESDEVEEVGKPLVLKNVLPQSLKHLVIGLDSREHRKITEPLAIWIEGMGKRDRYEEGGTKLEEVKLLDAHLWAKEMFVRDERFARLAVACNVRGIRPSVGLL